MSPSRLDPPTGSESSPATAPAKKPVSFSLRSLTSAYGLLVSLPLVILLGIVFQRSSSLERTAIEQRLLHTAADLADDIDRDIERRLTTLRVLASMSSLALRDWPAFHDRARSALRDEAYAVVLDRDLRQVVNTYVPLGTQPATSNIPAVAARVFETGEPAVSDVFVSRVTKGPVYAIVYPVKEQGRVEFLLLLALKTSDLAPILRGQQIEDGWSSAVWDNNDVVVGRSDDGVIGEKIPASLGRDRIGDKALVRTGADDSVGRGTFWRAIAASRHTGWRVSVAAPSALIEGPLRQSARLWGALSIGAALLSLTLGAMLARALSASFRPLREAAAAVGTGGPPPPLPAWTVDEASIVHDVLATSRCEIEKREQMLRESEQRLLRMLDIDAVGVLIFETATGVLRHANDAFLGMSGYTCADVAGRAVTW